MPIGASVTGSEDTPQTTVPPDFGVAVAAPAGTVAGTAITGGAVVGAGAAGAAGLAFAAAAGALVGAAAAGAGPVVGAAAGAMVGAGAAAGPHASSSQAAPIRPPVCSSKVRRLTVGRTPFDWTGPRSPCSLIVVILSARTHG